MAVVSALWIGAFAAATITPAAWLGWRLGVQHGIAAQKLRQQQVRAYDRLTDPLPGLPAPPPTAARVAHPSFDRPWDRDIDWSSPKVDAGLDRLIAELDLAPRPRPRCRPVDELIIDLRDRDGGAS